MTTLQDFLNEHGVEPQQIAAQSAAIEAKGAEEQARLHARHTARREKKAYADVGAEKPQRLGRGISPRIVKAAVDGQPVTRKNRQKIVRALESMLGPKGVEVDGNKLFADAPRKKAKAKDK